VTREHYIEPIKILCRDSVGDPRAVFLLKQVMECIYAFDNTEELKKFYSNHYAIDSNSLKKSLADMKNCLIEFKKM
jgi:hypothetical protein